MFARPRRRGCRGWSSPRCCSLALRESKVVARATTVLRGPLAARRRAEAPCRRHRPARSPTKPPARWRRATAGSTTDHQSPTTSGPTSRPSSVPRSSPRTRTSKERRRWASSTSRSGGSRPAEAEDAAGGESPGNEIRDKKNTALVARGCVAVPRRAPAPALGRGASDAMNETPRRRHRITGGSPGVQ